MAPTCGRPTRSTGSPRDTGGRAILNTNNFELGLRQVVEDASTYYLVGYTPTRTEDDGKFHKISVKVKRSGVRVIHRQRVLGAQPRRN